VRRCGMRKLTEYFEFQDISAGRKRVRTSALCIPGHVARRLLRASTRPADVRVGERAHGCTSSYSVVISVLALVAPW